MIKTVGMVAGDEESYVTFKELFDPVIAKRHGIFEIFFVDSLHDMFFSSDCFYMLLVAPASECQGVDISIRCLVFSQVSPAGCCANNKCFCCVFFFV